MLAALAPRFVEHPLVIGLRAAQNWACSRTKANPLKASVLIAGVKTTLADLFVQKVWEDKAQVDWKRNAVFSVFGLGYLGAWQYYLYSRLFPRWFPGTGALTTAACVVADQLVHSPCMYWPTFYICQESITSSRLDVETVCSALRSYSHNMVEDVTSCWAIWIPAQAVNFSVVPVHWRAPFVALVSALWVCIVSAMRGSKSS
mmetsp:Transcript_113130/g.365476  ORF Transcript_113130/g.365476 Transcript_113130/m.365476 type:complete len:202 (-) Transcript_113130:117-722(-)